MSAAVVTDSPTPVQDNPNVVKTNAVPVPPVTVKRAEDVLEAIKAKVKAANELPPVLQAQGGPAAEQVKEPVKDGEPQIQANQKELLAELAKYRQKASEVEAKLKEQESAVAEAGQFKELKELSAKDKLAAVTKLFGGDAEQVLADLVEMFYTKEGQPAPGAAQPSSKTEQVLLEKLEAVTKKLDALEAGTTEKAKASAEAQAKAEEEGVKAFLKGQLAKHKDTFEISARDENQDEAVAKAMAKAGDVAKRLGFDLNKLSPDQAEQIAKEAIAEAEKEFEQIGNRFAKQRQQEPSRSDRVYSRPFSAPQIKFSAKPAKESFDEYRARIAKEWEAQHGS